MWNIGDSQIYQRKNSEIDESIQKNYSTSEHIKTNLTDCIDDVENVGDSQFSKESLRKNKWINNVIDVKPRMH